MASVNQIPERNLDVGHGAQNSLLAYAHRILTAATPFCSLLPPLAALANVPLSTREPWGTGDADRRNQRPKFWDKIWLAVATPQARRPCGPPRNDNGFLSFRGAERRGNPSFLRWTGVRAAVPRAWPPPTKFRAEIWGVGQVVGPYGKPNQPPKPAGAQRSVRARGCEGWAGIDARTIPKGGPPLRLPRQRSERGKSSWSNSVFARQVSCSARGTGFGGFSKAPPVLALTLPQLSRTV